MASSIDDRSVHELIYFTIYSTGNLSYILPYFLNPFHFFQFYSHSLKIFTLLAFTFLLSELKDLPILTGTISSLDSKDYFALGDLNFSKKRQHLIRCSIGSVYTLYDDYKGFSEAFITSSMILVTVSN